MSNFQIEKELVLNFYSALDSSDVNFEEIYNEYVADDYVWRGYYPFGRLKGTEPASKFWRPFRKAITSMQRRQDIFFAGRNEIDNFNSTWVVSMGHLMGLFDTPWLGIRPTQKMVCLRYCEFTRVENGKLGESAMYFDIPHLMIQANQNPFPKSTGAHLVQPGPMTHDGLLFDVQDPKEGKATLEAINFMINDISTWNDQRTVSLTDELRRSWNEDMVWWGPAGIGATYTIERYAKQHSGPFRAAFKERKFNGHICRVAEGCYGGFFGWPNLTLKHHGGFMGMPATNQWGDMNVIDIYRRQGNKLSENWVFIDLLHFWKQQGIDILARSLEFG